MINFGDSNLIVSYIQSWLKENYDNTLVLSDVYDKNTHKALINYLKLPKIVDSYKIKDMLINEFTYKETEPPHKLIDGGGLWNFNFEMTPFRIKFYTRDTNETFTNGILFILQHINDVDEFCRQYGWYVSFYTKTNYKSKTKNKNIYFVINKLDRPQLLPSKDVLNMINLNCHDYILNKCFLDATNAYHGYIQNSNYYKILLIEAKPGDIFTISHGYEHSIEMAVGYVEASLNEIRNGNVIVNDIYSHMHNSVNGMLATTNYITYGIPTNSECTYLLIQLPYNQKLSLSETKQYTIKIGDINNDGIVDKTDLELLRQYVLATNNGNQPPFILDERSKIAANIKQDYDSNGNPIINDIDLSLFETRYLESQTSGTYLDFGTLNYEAQKSDIIDDVNKILVVNGAIEQYYGNSTVPLNEFSDNPWAIHEEFLPFIIGSAIHPYSNSNDISLLQEKIQKLNSRYIPKQWGYYDSAYDYLTNEKLIWNENKLHYEYWKNNVYTGYCYKSNDLINGQFYSESQNILAPIKIINSKLYINNKWTNKIVTDDGNITTQDGINSLKELVKAFQVEANRYYYKQTGKTPIRFINGYVTPETEVYLNMVLDDLD